MANFRHFLATSDHWMARWARAVRRGLACVSLPAPRWVVRPLLAIFLLVRGIYYYLFRILVCEPFFKAYCTRYGKRLRTGVYLHWVQGRGDILVGEGVELDGKSSFTFASRFSERPTLEIGDHTHVAHNVTFVVARRVRIGAHCLIATGARILDSSGHSTDPARRLAGLPPESDDVRSVVIGDNVWIGANAVVLPGVTIGDGSVIGTNSVVTRNVPAYSLVAGCPAKVIRSLLPADRERAIADASNPSEAAT
jgi:acetyltransferase-like isoleucine patch superfamily enzyme